MTRRETVEDPFGPTPKLLVSYDPETNTLDLSDGKSASYGVIIADGLTVFTDDGDIPHRVTIDSAADLLRDILVGKVAVSDHPAGQPLPSESE